MMGAINRRVVPVNGVAFGVKCAYSCILRASATHPPDPQGGEGWGGGGAELSWTKDYIYLEIFTNMWLFYTSRVRDRDEYCSGTRKVVEVGLAFCLGRL